MCFFEYWGVDGRNGLEIGEDWKWRASEGEVVWYDIHVAQRSLTTHNTLSSRCLRAPLSAVPPPFYTP